MKVLTGLITALVVSLTALVFAPAANARPYPHSIDTTCHSRLLDHSITKRQHPRVAFRITTPNSNAPAPHTRVFVKVTRDSNNRTVQRAVRFYNGGTERWSFKRLRPGHYTFQFSTKTGERSVYANCDDVSFLHVTR